VLYTLMMRGTAVLDLSRVRARTPEATTER
jgi:hypothetical protein